ncbi:peroxiredoxin C [Pectobacterium peruviense]|uniref:Thioredoxin peroxidase n=1 Tax=Pectobacterium peruviense TaxID=2066479 RepID=A0ABX4S603_9GAMM|nr:peroxiredoxin C [Pectobacterium peruviense]KML68815.1 peroxiredoxin [Pectobacterium peruviense]PKX83099.1 peroxiredoxin [Pectobacterium peruviense]PKX85521.1 peroxiredoxin [Pectobacterium peruviense]
MVLVTRQAPDFTAAAVLGSGEIVENFNLKKHINGKAAVIFFWPMDFTFVCPSELIAFDHRYAEFKKRGVEVVGISFDSEFVHNAWRKTPVDKGGIGEVQYAMVADIKREIQKAYGIEHPEAGVALRGSFLIDKNGVVRHQVVNDLPLGRNIDEMLRTVDALQFHEEHGEVCPAQWEKGKSGMGASPDGVAKYLSENADKL